MVHTSRREEEEALPYAAAQLVASFHTYQQPEGDPMTEQDPGNDTRIISYLSLRKLIGIIGFFLPIVLIIGKWLLQDGFPSIQASISGYYCTGVRDVLVGSLCALGVFLLSYKGYDRPASRLPYIKGRDDLASNLAGIGAIGVALFPTTCGPDPTTFRELTVTERYGGLHVVFAALFFISLAYILIFLFTRHDPEEGLPPQKWIYRVCGLAIIVSILLIPVVWFLPRDVKETWHPVIWLEWAAILAFSISWFRKGMRREPQPHAPRDEHPRSQPRVSR
jgi:Protein of unknown function (DUF998)